MSRPFLFWKLSWPPLPPLFDCQTAKHHRPYSLRPRVGRSPPRLRGDKLSFPRINRGDGAPMGASFSVSHVPLPARGASRRAIATSIRRRAALPAFRFVLPPAHGHGPFWAAAPSSLGQASRPAVSELLAGGRSAPGRNPGAARVQEERSSPARGRRIRSHFHHAS